MATGTKANVVFLSWILIFVVSSAEVRAQDESVLRWSVSSSSQSPGGKIIFDFNMNKFTEFYTCLCNKMSSKCQAYAPYSKVYNVDPRSELRVESPEKEQSKRYSCYLLNNTLFAVCERLNISDRDCYSIEGCSSYHLINHSISCDFEPIELTWQSGYVTEVMLDVTFIDLTPCKSGCVVTEIEAGITTSTTTNTSEDENNTTIIIAVVVSILAVLIVAAIIGIILWRRKKNATTRATTKDSTRSNGNAANPKPTNGGGASNATDLHNYSLATIDRDGKSSGNMDSVSVSYAKVGLEKKHAARRSAAKSTNNEESQYSEYNSNQNYSEVGPPVPPYNGDHIATGVHGFSDNSTPKFKGNGKIAVNSADNGVSYSEIAVNNNDDEDNETEPYSVSGSNGPSDSKTGTNVDDPQYTFASNVKPGPGNVYSQLHDPVRNITNPYNDLMPEDGSANNNVETRPGHEYSRLHDPVRNINNPYNVLMADGDQLNNRTSV